MRTKIFSILIGSFVAALILVFGCSERDYVKTVRGNQTSTEVRCFDMSNDECLDYLKSKCKNPSIFERHETYNFISMEANCDE